MKPICILLSILLAAAAFPAGSLSVQGSVKSPGSITATEGLRVREAVNRAGGLLPDADQRVTVVKPDGTSSVVDLSKLGPTPLLASGSKIIVDKFDTSKYVVVNGAVLQPGAIAYRAGMSVKDALTSARAFPEAKVETVKVSNAKSGKVKDVKVGDLQTVVLQPGDTVEVAYNNQAFSERQLVVILLIVVLVVLIVR